MKKIYFLLLINFISLTSGFSQQLSMLGHLIPVNTSLTPNQPPFRILFAFAELPANCQYANTNTNYWQPGQLPSFHTQLIDNAVTNNPQGYITKYFYDASFGQYNVIGDFVDHVISIPCGSTDKDVIDVISNLYNSSSLNLYYNTPLSDFDNYTILGGGQEYFLKPAVQDNSIDAVIVIWRNNPFYGYNSGFGLSFYYFFPHPIGSYGINSGCAFGSDGNIDNVAFILQEFFHGMYGENNWHNGNGAGIHTFPFFTNPWGIPTQYAGAGMSNVVSGWDRVFCNWTGWADLNQTTRKQNLVSAVDENTGNEIISDFPAPQQGTHDFILRDFVTYGDVIRIKMPHIDCNVLGDVKNQYLWIENHQKITSFDHSFWEDIPCKSPWRPGMYAQMQIGKDVYNTLTGNFQIDPHNSHSEPNYSGSFLFPLTANGNWDYQYGASFEDQTGGACIWNGKNTPIKPCDPLTLANPFTGFSKLYSFYNSDGNDQLDKNADTYFSSSLSEIDCNNNLVFNAHFRGDSFTAFRLDNNPKISIATNPASTPVYTLESGSNFNISSLNQSNQSYENRTIWLNGVSAEVLQENVNSSLFGQGAVKVRVRFDDYDVDRNVRWCGNIKLSPNDFNAAQPSLILKSGKTILLDRGKSPTHVYATGTDPITGDYLFTLPTFLSCLNGAYLKMESNSQLILENNSILHLETGSQLSMESNSILRVKSGCKLILDSKSTVINNGGRIIIEVGGTLAYQEADIILSTANSTLEIAGLLDLKSPVTAAYNIFTFSGLGYILFNSPQSPSANVACTPGDCIFQLVGGTGQLLLKVTQESLRLPVGLAKFIVEGGVCQFTGYSAARVLGATTKTTLWGTVFTSTTGSYNTHNGLMLYGGDAAVSYSTFLHGYQGIRNLNGDFTVEYSTFQDCGVGVLTDGGSFDINNSVFNQNRGFGISADNMTLPCLMTSNEIKYTALTNGIGVFFDGSLTSSLYAENNYIHDNIVGMQIKNTQLKGICNSVKNNQTNGIEINQGATLDFSGSPTLKPSNAIQNNDISLKLSVAKNLFLADGYNSLTPIQSGVQKAVRGTIKKTCPNPSAINAIYNEWNTNGTFSTNDYALTTVAGQSGCATAIPVTINDPNPIAFVSCSYTQPLVAAPENPLYDCNNCETIYTSNFNGDKLNEAGVAALQQTTETGGSSDAQAVTLFNEMLMYNLPTPDEKEKYILNYSYAKMGAALGAAFKNNALSITDNTPALSSEVQQMMEVLNKHLAEAIGNGDTLDRFYYSLDKANVYRLAGRRDLAFPILDDMFNWTTASDELDYLNYKNCITHLEQDLIDSIITADEYMDASLICGQQSSGLRVLSSTIVKQDKSLMAISSAYAAQNITVSPNPATDRLNIYYTQEQPLTIVIKEVTGREIHRSVLNSHSSLDCSSFAKGLYTLQLFDKENIRVYNSKVLLK